MLGAMKKILLTNDDGLHSPGLTTLVHELLRTGRYDLRVVAPEKEQSGVSYCITIHWPLLPLKPSRFRLQSKWFPPSASPERRPIA